MSTWRPQKLLKKAIFFCFTSCMVGPNYEAPVFDVAESFVEEEKMVGKEAPLSSWWDVFADPVLTDLIEQAIEKSPTLEAACYRIEAVRSRYQLKAADLWPEVDAAGTFQRERISQALFTAPFSGPTTQNYFALGFDASWEIDFFGKLRREKRAAFDELGATIEGEREVYLTLVAETARLYMLMRGNSALVVWSKEEVDRLQLQVALLSSLFTAGLIQEGPVLEAKSALKIAEGELALFEAREKEALYELASVIGIMPEEVKPEWLIGKLPEPTGKVPVGVPSQILRQRPDVRKKERELAAASERIGAATARYFPSVSLTGSVSTQDDTGSDLFKFPISLAWSYSPSFTVPILNFGRIRALVDERKAEERFAYYAYEQAVLDALSDVEKKLVRYGKESEKYGDLIQSASLQEEKKDLAFVRYDAGLEAMIDPLTEEIEWIRGEKRKVTSQQEALFSLIALFKALGGDFHD